MDNASANYPDWKASVISFAGSIMADEYLYGLVHLVLTPAQFNALPNNYPAPNPARPPNPAAGAGAGAVALFKQDMDLHQRYLKATNFIKSSIVASLSPVLRKSLTDPAARLIVLDSNEIMDHLDNLFDVRTAHDIDLLHARLARPLASHDMDLFLTFTGEFIADLAMLALAGHPLSEHDKMKRFQSSTAMQPAVAEACVAYVRLNPVLANRDLPGMVEYVRLQLCNLTVSDLGFVGSSPSSGAESAQKRPGGGTSDMVSRAELTDMLKSVMTPISEAIRELKQPQQQVSKENKTVLGGRRYCYRHGYGGHNGHECFIMANDSKFTPSMRRAKTHKDVMGGQK